MTNKTLTRQELYNLVWSTPMTTLAKQYNTSDAALRKICVNMNIPLPKSGHWEKVRVGKSVEIPELPSDYTGDEKVDLSTKAGEGLSVHAFLNTKQKELEDNSALSFVVPERLTNPDKLIVAAQKTLTGQKPYSSGTDQGLVHTYRGEIEIRVTPGNVSRSLRFMDAFIKLIRARGYKVIFEHEAYVVIGEDKFEISLKEKMKRTFVEGNYSWRTAIDNPTGTLCLRLKERAYRVLEWKDGKLPIEKQLSKILVDLELHVQELKKERARINEYWRKEDEKRQKIEDAQKVKDTELNEFKLLLKKAKRWHEAEMIRGFIANIKSKSHSEETIDWIGWAERKADWYDPSIEAEDELLKDVDRETLQFKIKPFSLPGHFFKGVDKKDE